MSDLLKLQHGAHAGPVVERRTPGEPLGGIAARAGNRGVDLLLAVVLLVVAAPVLVVLALLVGLSSPGPVLYRQRRVGRGGKSFVMFKFRTMYKDNDDAVHRSYVTSLFTTEVPPDGGEPGIYKLSRDPRITRIGSFLRRSSLDELPQLLNVLRSDMSLVGPRPALQWEVDLFRPSDAVRSSVKPGITGLAQVSGRNRLTIWQTLDLDAEYLARHSLLLDLSILVRTIPAALISRDAR